MDRREQRGNDHLPSLLDQVPAFPEVLEVLCCELVNLVNRVNVVNLVNPGSDNHVVHRSDFKLATVAILLAAAIVSVAACANSEAKRREAGINPTYDRQTGKLTQLEFDSNHDGRPDTWTDMDGTRPVPRTHHFAYN